MPAFYNYPTVPVSHWERNEWIAAFVIGLTLVLVRFITYTMAKYSMLGANRTTVAATTNRDVRQTTTTFQPQEYIVGAGTTTLTSIVAPFENTVPAAVHSTDFNNGNESRPHHPNSTASQFRFTREGLQSCSNILLFGFLILVANAAFSGTVGYVSRSTMALSWALMTVILIWAAMVVFIRNHLVPLFMIFLTTMLFIAFWSIVFHQTRGA